MNIRTLPAEPTLPFIRMNRYHILQFSLDEPDSRKAYQDSFPKMPTSDFEDGRFKEDAFIVDVNCWKFPIRDVVNLGPSRDFWDIFWCSKMVKVQYLYDIPIKLSFEQAREEIVELICSKRWFSKTQDRESQKQFRERMEMCENMHDLIVGAPNTDLKSRKRFQWIGGLSFYGEWVG
jgi:hypothetical protein